MIVTYILIGNFDRFRTVRSSKCAFSGGDFQVGVKMKKKNSFTFALLVLFAMVPCFGMRALGGTIRSGRCYTWGISTDTVAIPAGSVITEAVLTIHNLSSSSDNPNDSLDIYLLDEPQVGFVENTEDGGSPFEEQGVRMMQAHHEQSQGEQDVAYTFSELTVESSPLWEHFGYPLVFGPDGQMVIESSLVLDLIDYAGSGTSFGFGFYPNGNVDYNFDQITLELTIESFEGPVEQSSLILTTTDESGLIGHWTMDDNAASTVVIDSSGNNNDGLALYNTSVLHQTGIIGGALDFDGTNDYIDCGNSVDFNITDAITISAWVKFDTVAVNHQTIVAKRGAIADQVANYVLRTGPNANQDQIQFYYHDGTDWHVYTTSNANLIAGRWYHIVATFTFGTAASMKCYLNNNVLAGNWNRGDGNSPVPTNTKPVTIGGLTTGKYLDGIIDDVRLYDRALSDSEIETLSNQPPTANAGPDQTTTDCDENGEQVNLDASGSYDLDGTIVSWVWSDDLGDTIPDGQNTTATLNVGTHTITLTVTDDDGATDTDTVIVTVELPNNALVGHWKMDDSVATTTVVDSSCNGNDGAAQQNTEDIADAGIINGALTFNGTTDYIDCGNSTDFDITDEITISAWVKFDTVAVNHQTIVAKRGAIADQVANYVIRTGPNVNQDQIQFYYHDGTDWHVYTTSNANLVAGQWYHIAATFTFGTGSSMKCYLNNNVLAGNWNRGDGNSPVPTNTKPVTIGGLTTGKYLDGAIDNVKIFDTVLSEEEIKTLYNEGSGT
ncbi:MAG: hypothetical protein DRP65_01765 [Planctomycetota bacterium]|nr:MAG: hypothetical protein DRP65_01765 [Planctomycetota bacterium]